MVSTVKVVNLLYLKTVNFVSSERAFAAKGRLRLT